MPSFSEPDSTLSQLDRPKREFTRAHGHVLSLDEFRRHLDEHEQVLNARHVPPPPPRAQPDPEAASETDRMRQLRAAIARRLEHGDTLDTIDRELIAPTGLAEEQQSALWLYAWSHPKRQGSQPAAPVVTLARGLGSPLAKQAGHDKHRLLGDLDCVVSDPLNGAGDEDHERLEPGVGVRALAQPAWHEARVPLSTGRARAKARL